MESKRLTTRRIPCLGQAGKRVKNQYLKSTSLNSIFPQPEFIEKIIKKDENNGIIECGICLEEFLPKKREPKLLPCGHNFCETCLFSLCLHREVCLLFDYLIFLVLFVGFNSMPKMSTRLHS